MEYKSFETSRLKCRPLVIRDINNFYLLVEPDSLVKKYFRFGSSRGEIGEFIVGLNNPSSEVIHVGIFLKSSNELIGYIGGYFSSFTELCVEYFISEKFRRQKYCLEALYDYIHYRRLEGITSFHFKVEDGNEASACLLKKLGAAFSETSVMNERSFDVYTLV